MMGTRATFSLHVYGDVTARVSTYPGLVLVGGYVDIDGVGAIHVKTAEQADRIADAFRILASDIAGGERADEPTLSYAPDDAPDDNTARESVELVLGAPQPEPEVLPESEETFPVGSLVRVTVGVRQDLIGTVVSGLSEHGYKIEFGDRSSWWYDADELSLEMRYAEPVATL